LGAGFLEGVGRQEDVPIFQSSVECTVWHSGLDRLDPLGCRVFGRSGADKKMLHGLLLSKQAR